MERSRVYQVIDDERDYQDRLGPRADKTVGDYLTLLDVYLQKAQTAWAMRPGTTPALVEIRKIAAIAVRCMEEHGAPFRISNAPWTDEQVKNLNDYQASGVIHPFTGERKPDGDETILIATREGWVEQESGPVVQTWAHSFMVNGSWRQRLKA